jgi:subtilisin
MAIRRFGLVLSIGLVAHLTVLSIGPAGAGAIAGDFVVVLRAGSDPVRSAEDHGIAPTRVFSTALWGYSARLTSAQLTSVSSDAQTDHVDQDKVLRTERPPPNTDISAPRLRNRQEVPTGIQRIGGLLSPTAKIDGQEDPMNVDVAILDTGLDASHPDLRVVATKNCVGRKYRSENHGTHVAGIVAAKDNGFGVVGVAPGARIWSVRIFDNKAETTLSTLLCALDYVARRSDRIEVANMSAGFVGTDGGSCGLNDDDPVSAAICNLRARGVLLTSSAGNGSQDGAETLPGAYEQAVSVSAFSDYDGVSGGLASPTCFDGGPDDTLAWYSNFGTTVDISAPGTCILSAWAPKPNYEYEIGTSMAAPHVAGAIALYRLGHPDASPNAVLAAVISAGEPGPLSADTDGDPEPLLDVSTF